VRPHNADVLFEIGREKLAANDLDGALDRWEQCYTDAGPLQLKIVNLLAGRIPAAKFVDTFKPDWPMLRYIWIRYSEAGHQEDLDRLLTYSVEKTKGADEANGLPPANADFADTIKIPQVMYHDLRFEWNIKNGHGIGRDLQFYYGVDNLLDKHPPLGILATGAGPGALGNAGLYEVRGRTFYGGFRARF